MLKHIQYSTNINKSLKIKIILATQSQNKFTEFKAIFEPLGVKFLPLSQFTKHSPKETGGSFAENAIIKAYHAGELSNWKFPCLADDSGLCIKVLSNQPGIYSARWATEDNYTHAFKLIKNKIALKGEKINGQPAFFTCCLALLFTPTKKHIFTGVLQGKLTYPPRGKFGFGYDPIFIPNQTNKTLAELSKTEKNNISHRKLAFLKLKEFIFDK